MEKQWSVSLTLTVEAEDEKQALDKFSELVSSGLWDGDSVEVEPEVEEDEADASQPFNRPT